MNRTELRDASEAIIRAALRRHLPAGAPVYLYGSRARGDAAWHSDYDIWVDADLPQRVIKAWYLAGHLTEDDYLALLAAIDDRNRLSHVYDGETFTAIIARLPAHAVLLRRVLLSLQAGQQGDGAALS